MRVSTVPIRDVELGGATALSLAGAHAEEIRAYGGWKSDVFKRYIQPVSESKVKAATRMVQVLDSKKDLSLKAAGKKESLPAVKVPEKSKAGEEESQEVDEIVGKIDHSTLHDLLLELAELEE